MRTIIGVILIMLYGSALAGPFGTYMGMPEDEFTQRTEVTPGWFSVRPPIINDLFDVYVGVIHEDGGLCSIAAISEDIPVNGYGTGLKVRYRELVGLLSAKYGDDTNVLDILVDGSIGEKNQYFMMGLLKQDRIIATRWSVEDGLILPDDIYDITVYVYAMSPVIGHVSVTYKYNNYLLCEVQESVNNSEGL